jgi:uncharacterized protein (DUF1499 family)
MNMKVLNALQWIVLSAAVVGALLVGLAGPANKAGVTDYVGALTAFKYGAYLGVGAAALALVVAILRLTQRKGVFWCVLALALGGGTFYFPYTMMQQAKAVPPIHDVSTDTRAPPQFVALVAARGKDSNSLEPDPEAAEAQAKAYPDIEPLVLEMPLEQGWARALAAARTMGWDIVTAEAAEGQIEATETTKWFGFKDDIVIRVHQIDPTHTRVDMRSVSRVGRSDLGVNANRIRKYLKAVQG